MNLFYFFYIYTRIIKVHVIEENHSTNILPRRASECKLS